MSTEEEKDQLEGFKQRILKWSDGQTHDKRGEAMNAMFTLDSNELDDHNITRIEREIKIDKFRIKVLLLREGGGMAIYFSRVKSKSELYLLFRLNLLSPQGNHVQIVKDVMMERRNCMQKVDTLLDTKSFALITFNISIFQYMTLPPLENVFGDPDALILCKGEAFHVSRALIAPWSDFFRDLFRNGEGELNTYEIKVCTSDELRDFLSFVDVRKGWMITNTNVLNLLQTARVLKSPTLTELCEEFLLQLQSVPRVDSLKFGEMYKMTRFFYTTLVCAETTNRFGSVVKSLRFEILNQESRKSCWERYDHLVEREVDEKKETEEQKKFDEEKKKKEEKVKEEPPRADAGAENAAPAVPVVPAAPAAAAAPVVPAAPPAAAPAPRMSACQTCMQPFAFIGRLFRPTVENS